MNCPVCKKPTIVIERHKVELDYCLECHGVWFDEEEFPLLLEAQHGEAGEFSGFSMLPALNALEHRREREYQCPRCRKAMDKIEIGCHEADEPPVLVDRCPDNHGLWFDQGEMKQVMDHYHRRQAKAPLPGDTGMIVGEKVLRFIGETLDNVGASG